MTRALAIARRIAVWGLCLPVLVYRYLISPIMAPSCRFAPSCSAYALDAIRTHGPVTGPYLAVRRILKCHPWGGGGYDPVPAPRPKRAG